ETSRCATRSRSAEPPASLLAEEAAKTGGDAADVDAAERAAGGAERAVDLTGERPGQLGLEEVDDGLDRAAGVALGDAGLGHDLLDELFHGYPRCRQYASRLAGPSIGSDDDRRLDQPRARVRVGIVGDD